MDPLPFNKLTIIGAGLIGGSLARALKKSSIDLHITAYSRHEANLELAKELGVIDAYELELAQAVAAAEVIVLATPVGSYEALLPQVHQHAPTEVIITDAGSTKGSVVALAKKYLADRYPLFVPGHPIAGTEQSGVGASMDDLFQGKKVILTPTAETDVHALEVVTQMWQHCGAQVDTLSVSAHDRILAATSHLPHVLAYALVNALAEQDQSEEVFQFAAGGFRDFTRIASSDAVMWRDICLENRTEILRAIESYRITLNTLEEQIKLSDRAALLASFERAQEARRKFLELFEDNSAPST
ncbi:MAG TPA: prephenate dehydrogenase/arogenate dehydrogenase family protein [Gammaproteobacteria bacterium]|nr:prephenate dehydrogenase/arogenate dehydrogenase family protein [Gammaproteobacteria bacterium]